MARKRSRSRDGDRGGDAGGFPDRPSKHVKPEHGPHDAVVKHGVLAQYYVELRTLRQHVLSKLPASSRIRRKKIASVGVPRTSSEKPLTEDEVALGDLLDSAIVARRDRVEDHDGHRWKQWAAFSQRGDESYVTLSGGLKGSIYSQSEIVDFVIWLLFSREDAKTWPKHMLCDGFRRQAMRHEAATGTEVPGLCVVYPNQQAQTLKESPWPQLLMLLGREGDRIMIDLLVDCAIFMPVKAGRGNYYQLSGIPIFKLEPLSPVVDKESSASFRHGPAGAERRPSEITFVRSRMLYARASLNARGLVHFGLRHIHVLNRFPYKDSPASDQNQPDEGVVRIMMYIFPRQFGLHNVFTSTVDRRQTAQKFQDYTLREEEIAAKFPKVGTEEKPTFRVPKRLRGTAVQLVRRLQVLHKRCAYVEMLQHYCPLPGQTETRQVASSQGPSTKTTLSSSKASSKAGKSRKKSRPPSDSLNDVQFTALADLATPVSSVSAFCQKVVSKVIPDDFWGQDPSSQEHNKACFLKKVHHFVRLRRFESMCLHEVMQGMRISDIGWLKPPGLEDRKSSQSDIRKRIEIFYEFLYYLFDSFLIPLIRSNFYVTESSVDRYRLFFFRHDVWRYVAEPAMAALKTSMFEEVRLDEALRILQSRPLGFSQIRLLPKQTTMRPITNLRRRMLLKGDKKGLGPSINTILSPVSSMLKLEKSRHPGSLGSSMFSVGEIHSRVRAFKDKLGDGSHEFFFAKVDVQAAFDTIPQDAIIELMKQIPKQSYYKMATHVEVGMVESGTGTGSKTAKRWQTVAKPNGDTRSFAEVIEESFAAKRRETIFIDNGVRKSHYTKDLLALMETHIAQNLVRIGKKYYRQKTGIPQGSVLSSILCNYFYADLERNHLGFLQADDCLLLRLIDDFLLITTDRDKAQRFVDVMQRGLPQYGVTVNPEKSLTNFPLIVRGSPVPRPDNPQKFPYCGLLIDCKTLAVAKRRDVSKDTGVFNSLTVEFSRCPGRNFTRKVISAFKIQSHLMLFDTSLNPRRTVLTNIYSAFVETATKMWAYARCMAVVKRPSSGVVVDTIKTLIDVAFVLLTSRARKARYPGYECTVRKMELAWLAMVAFRQVLVRKQAGYREVIGWLEEETRKLALKKRLDCEELVKVARALQERRRSGGKP
ncbi:hypothetical protein VTK26DRAFT_7436 [Humicola hyalothermophila]